MPLEPSRHLVGMIRELKLLEATHGSSSVTYIRLEMLICVEVKSQISRGECIALASSQNWPQKINFKNLPNRIISMKDDIKKFIMDRSARENSTIYQRLLKDFAHADLGSSLVELAAEKVAPWVAIQNARPG